MKSRLFFSLLSFLVFYVTASFGQTYNRYKISFPNAVHHEAEVSATFSKKQILTTVLIFWNSREKNRTRRV